MKVFALLLIMKPLLFAEVPSKIEIPTDKIVVLNFGKKRK
jgi:hypothetical protein